MWDYALALTAMFFSRIRRNTRDKLHQLSSLPASAKSQGSSSRRYGLPLTDADVAINLSKI